MTSAGRALAFGLVALTLSAGCAAPPATDGSQVFVLDEDGLRVNVPAAWEALRSNDVGVAGGRVLFYLSNQALQVDCVPSADEPRCGLPVEALEDGGVLLLWATVGCAGTACELPEGERRLISGREAATAPDAGACAEIDATAEDVYAVTVTPQRVDWVIVCTRSPGDEERAQLASILDGVDWRTP